MFKPEEAEFVVGERYPILDKPSEQEIAFITTGNPQDSGNESSKGICLIFFLHLVLECCSGTRLQLVNIGGHGHCICFRAGSDLFFNPSGLWGIPAHGTYILTEAASLQKLRFAGSVSHCTRSQTPWPFAQLSPVIDPTVTHSWVSEWLFQRSWTLLTVSLQQNEEQRSRGKLIHLGWNWLEDVTSACVLTVQRSIFSRRWSFSKTQESLHYIRSQFDCKRHESACFWFTKWLFLYL